MGGGGEGGEGPQTANEDPPLIIHSTLSVSVVWGLGESRVSCGTPASRWARRVSQGPSFRCPCATPASCQPHTAAPRRPPSMRRVPVAEVRHSAALRPPATRVHVHGRKPDGRQAAACSVDWCCAPYRVSPRALPAASRRSRGVLRRYAAVSIAEVGRPLGCSPAACCARSHVCVRGRKMVALASCLLRGLALRGRDHGQRPRCRAHCFLDIWRADTPVISRRARVCVAVRAAPRGAQHYKRASARADAARDHGKESRPRTCRDGCAAHRVQTSEQTPRLWRPNLRDEETRRVERTPHRCRIDGATHRPGAIQDLAVSARCRSSLPRRPGCPPPVGIEAKDRRPTKYSIDRCSVLPAEQGGNLDRT